MLVTELIEMGVSKLVDRERVSGGSSKFVLVLKGGQI